MAKQPNHFLIGVFVLCAVAVLLVGLVVLGSGGFFKEERKVVAFFQGSVQGLKVGAGVTFRGVKIGEVTDVQVHLDLRDGTSRVPVIFTFYPDKIIQIGERSGKVGETLMLMVEKGLRAQLAPESIVTGILGINLDYFPGSKERYVGSMPEYLEIPTIPSTLQQLSNALQDLPLKEIVTAVKDITERVSAILKSEDGEIMVESLMQSVEEFRSFLRTSQTLIRAIEQHVDPVSGEMSATLGEARLTLQQVRETFAYAQSMLSEPSGGGQDLRELIVSLREAAEQVKELADYLERNPESLLRGKRE